MRKFQKTAIAAAVAQIAVIYGGAAWAQTTDTTSADPAASKAAVVTVTGQRAAIQSAQKLKQEADEVVDSIVAEDIGKLPDRSITEVLSRVVGVTMDRSAPNDPQHYAVEGSGIAIRGLTYVLSELNGREAFSANGGRSLSFSDVPPELMAGVDVYKNPSAEHIEGGISGIVNLRTAMPFDFKGFKGAATVNTSYSELLKKRSDPSGSVLFSNRWTTPLGEVGALIDLASSKTNTRNDAMNISPYYPHVNDIVPGKTMWVPKGAEWRSQTFNRNRKGDYAAFQWRPVRDLTAGLTYFRSRYREDWSEQALLTQETNPYEMQVQNGVWSNTGALLAGTWSNPENGGVNYNSDRRVSDRHSSTQDIALNINWRVSPAWTVVSDFQRIKARTQGFDSDVATGIRVPSQAVDFRGDRPVFSFTPADLAYFADPKNYYWAYTMEHLDNSTADSKAWKTDVKYDFDHPVLRDIRFGVRLQNRDTLNQNTNPSYNWQGVTQPWMVGWRIPHEAFLSDPRFAGGASLVGQPNFFGGDVTIPGVWFPDDAVARGYPNSYAKLHGYSLALCEQQKAAQGWGDCVAWKPAGFADDPASINQQSEKTRAFYTQARFSFDDWGYPIDGNIGVRYVKTTSNAFGYTVFAPNLPTIPEGASVVGANLIPNIPAFSKRQDYENTYHNWLPSLNLRYKAADNLQFRFAVAKSMSRPDFGQLAAYTSLSQSVRSTTTGGGDTGLPTTVTFNGVSLTGTGQGNPNLRPATATSVDLTAEWYFAKAGSLTFAMFNKDIKNIIVNQNYQYAVKDAAGTDRQFLVTGPTNGAHGYARGVEVAYQQYFDFVPDWLKGLGTQLSFTFVDSERKLNNPVYSEWCSGGEGADNLNLSINGCDVDMRSFGNLPLQGLSKRTINVALMYERGPVQARLAYNWRSRYLLGVNQWGTRGTDARDMNPASPAYGTYNGDNNQAYGLPLWMDDYGQLDGSFFYNVTPKLRIGVEATNLTDTTVKQLMQQHIGMLGRAWFKTGRSFGVRASYDF
ncbi:TonB-dependent receptor [Massilia sp. BSC265]|uniref:TonB-dependent receptor n=1 Tax=Massilia sp. BSC265 TaxID=1549812 RepID=UPI0004E87F87|nr:TonB-dependent receptor [Massilia sp. BSC265]KFI07482.1 TonB-dependent receptor [Massilia sp. BSC265]